MYFLGIFHVYTNMQSAFMSQDSVLADSPAHWDLFVTPKPMLLELWGAALCFLISALILITNIRWPFLLCLVLCFLIFLLVGGFAL